MLAHRSTLLPLLLLILLTLGVASGVDPIKAQTDSPKKDSVVVPPPLWDHSLLTSLNLSQVGFTHWAAGGTNAIAYISTLAGKSVRDVPTTNWATTYKLTFGQTKLGDQAIRKTDDEINLESVLTYKWGVKVNPYASVSFLSQFAKGFKYFDGDTAPALQISNIFDPAYIKQSAGVGWTVSKFFQTRLGAALREIVTNHFNTFADDPKTPQIETTRIEGGLESVSELELPIEESTLLRSKLELFAPVKSFDRIVSRGSVALIERISKVFSAEFNALIVNEPDISPFTQMKQGLSIGITYAIL